MKSPRSFQGSMDGRCAQFLFDRNSIAKCQERWGGGGGGSISSRHYVHGYFIGRLSYGVPLVNRKLGSSSRWNLNWESILRARDSFTVALSHLDELPPTISYPMPVYRFRYSRREKEREIEKSAISSGLTNGDRLFSIADRRLRIGGRHLWILLMIGLF